jgi:polysaccharide pyruvyl transferase WcaK-like protein
LSTHIVESFDPVLKQLSLPKYQTCTSEKTLVLIPRMNASNEFFGRSTALLNSGDFQHVKILSLQPDSVNERENCIKLQGLCGARSSIVPIRTLEALASEIGCSSFVLTERFHGAIAALAIGRSFEVVSQGSGDKFAALPSNADRPSLILDVQKGEEALLQSILKMRKMSV